MSHPEEKTIPRRTFLVCAAGMGAALAGLRTEALASAMAPLAGTAATVDLMYWNGNTFVPASSMSTGDQKLSRVSVTFEALGGDGNVRSIDLLPRVQMAGTQMETAYLAWTAPPIGM